MMPEDVRKAVELLDYTSMPITTEANCRAWQTIRAHLLAREAEVEMLRAPFSDEDATAGSHWFGEWVTWKRRCERAEALLRYAHPFVPITYSSTGQPQLHARITAHLSENSRG